MTEALARSVDVPRLLRVLAAHPVLPPIEVVSSDTEALRSVLADLARGEDSSEAETLRAVAADLVVPVEELTHRAQFVLACLILPSTGTHYEVLGVAPDASAQEIRKRWAELIQRYHPDRFGGGTSWLDGQARRLIEAYHTLKDPVRRRTYDAQLANASALSPVPAPQDELVRHRFRPARWRCVPVGMAAASLAVFLWALSRPTPPPLPKAPLPPAPKLLEPRSPISPVAVAGTVPRPHGISEVLRGPEPLPSEPLETPSVRDRLRMINAFVPSTVAPTTAEGIPSRPPGWTPSSLVEPASARSVSSAVASPPALAPAPVSPLSGLPPAAPTAEPASPSSMVTLPLPSSTAVTTGIAEPMPFSATDAGARSTAPAVNRSVPVHLVQPRASVPRDELIALIERFRVAYERKDLDTLMSLCTVDVRDRRASGRTSVKQLYARNFAALDGIRYELTRLEVAAAGAEQFVATGRFQIRATRIGTPPRPLDSSGSVRWQLRRESGDLRITAIDYEHIRQ